MRISDFSKFSADLVVFLSVFFLCFNQLINFVQFGQIFKAVKYKLKPEIGGAPIKAVGQRAPT
jgi:hypothetical protein